MSNRIWSADEGWHDGPNVKVSLDARGRMTTEELMECHICSEETTEEQLEPTFEGYLRGYYGGKPGALVVHGHYQLASYDHGRRPVNELSIICLEEMAAIGAPISEEDRALYLADDADTEDFDRFEWIHECVDETESRLPDGYIAFSDADMGTWTLWAIDRDHFETALARYAEQS